MDIDQPIALLGGLSPQAFMTRHWQKRPLLVRGALAQGSAPLTRAELFALAAHDGVESRLVTRDGGVWAMRQGPFARRQLPALSTREWTLLVQGVDLHVDAAHALLSRFRFVPDARLDDLMISYASDGGGVGPHFDSYDVFLLQAQGRRRWRIGRMRDATLEPDVPLKILSNFVVKQEWLLEPGDMLYLPPQWAHEGVAEGECITCSIGFRAASGIEAAREVLQLMLDAADDESPRYRDPKQAATKAPAALPEGLRSFTRNAIQRLLDEPGAFDCALGEWLTTPKPQVWFDDAVEGDIGAGVRLDRRTRMLYDGKHLFINGDALRMAGRDAALMRRLADARSLDADTVARASQDALTLMEDWRQAGWLHAATPGDG